ncbi:MAG: hypothetical protein JXR53_08095 [Bacteroidales bacterium]|nr:hypothetical protein [Bacteroidales bacterium]
MRPAKALFPFSAWMLRISMPVIAYSTFFETVKTFDFSELQFYIAAIFSLFSVFLFVGGFMAKHSMTLFSALVLLGVSLFEAFHFISKNPDPIFALFLLSAAAMLLFLSIGNKR